MSIAIPQSAFLPMFTSKLKICVLEAGIKVRDK